MSHAGINVRLKECAQFWRLCPFSGVWPTVQQLRSVCCSKQLWLSTRLPRSRMLRYKPTKNARLANPPSFNVASDTSKNEQRKSGSSGFSWFRIFLEDFPTDHYGNSNVNQPKVVSTVSYQQESSSKDGVCTLRTWKPVQGLLEMNKNPEQAIIFQLILML